MHSQSDGQWFQGYLEAAARFGDTAGNASNADVAVRLVDAQARGHWDVVRALLSAAAVRRVGDRDLDTGIQNIVAACRLETSSIDLSTVSFGTRSVASEGPLVGVEAQVSALSKGGTLLVLDYVHIIALSAGKVQTWHQYVDRTELLMAPST